MFITIGLCQLQLRVEGRLVVGLIGYLCHYYSAAMIIVKT